MILYEPPSLTLKGDSAMVDMVNRRHTNAEVRYQPETSPYGNGGDQSATETGFPRLLQIFPVSIIPLVFHANYLSPTLYNLSILNTLLGYLFCPQLVLTYAVKLLK
jgi:hypothetical protein